VTPGAYRAGGTPASSPDILHLTRLKTATGWRNNGMARSTASSLALTPFLARYHLSISFYIASLYLILSLLPAAQTLAAVNKDCMQRLSSLSTLPACTGRKLNAESSAVAGISL